MLAIHREDEMLKALTGLPLLLLAACNANGGVETVKLSGQSISKNFNAGAFDKVSLEGPDDVVVRVGRAASVTAKGDSALIERLEIEVENGQLKIGRDGRNWNIVGERKSQVVTVTVTLPALGSAIVAGSGNMSVDRVAGRQFSAVVAGSGDLTLGAVETGAMKMAIAGSGNVSATGRAQSAELSIAGSGDIEAGHAHRQSVGRGVRKHRDRGAGKRRGLDPGIGGREHPRPGGVQDEQDGFGRSALQRQRLATC